MGQPMVRMRSHARWVMAACAAMATVARAEPPQLRTAAAVQALGPEAAAERRDVRLRGVVTFTWHTGTSEFTVQDGTGAVLLPTVPLPRGCRVGAEVEVEGRTEAGGFGPIVQPEVVRVLGESALPPPVPTTYEGLLTPELHGRRVEIIGIVRGQRVNPELGLNWLALEIAAGGARLTVNVTHEITGHPELIDARVKVRGVNLHASDPHQQAFLPMICAHDLGDIDVVEPAPAQPFDQRAVPLSALLRSADMARSGHRARVRGTVILVREGGSLFLQDATRGIQVFLREAPLPALHETVDMVGFPEPGVFSPVLRDADWRPSEGSGFPEALDVTAAEAMRHDGRLIRLEARVAHLLAQPDRTVLMLEEGPARFRAVLPEGETSRRWLPGSRLRLTGVCEVTVGGWESIVTHRRPEGFSLLLRRAGDIAVLRRAPFWTAERLAWGATAAAALAAAMLGTVWARSRRRLREALEAREVARAEFSAILNERGRISREIHDTLAQGFAGISAQLEALSDRLVSVPDDARQHLDLAKELVRESLAEARRSVWNLRAQSLDEHGLAGAIERLGRHLTATDGIDFSFRVEGTSRDLPPDVENSLLRIAQEAIANAVRHSGARHVAAGLRYDRGQVTLEVEDDGRGFDSGGHPAGGRDGGFGLSGIRERAEAMHAALQIQSRRGEGTRIEVAVGSE